MSEQSSSKNLLTRNETYEEDTDLDAEDDFDAEKVKVSRGMSKEYVKIETLVDYPTIEFRIEFHEKQHA